MTERVQLTTYVDARTAERLAALAGKLERPVAHLIRQAIAQYLEGGAKRGR